MILTIYVPAADDAHGILPGSAIVGQPKPEALADDPGRVRLDYEGGRYGQSDFADFEVRLMHAADRHVWNGGKGYPTVARIWLHPDDVVAVGTYDTDAWRVVEITDQVALDAWTARYGERETP